MKTLEISTDERGLVTVALNLPETRNALSAQMIEDLTEMAHTIGEAPETRVILLKGNGKTFCAGGDLKWMQEQINADRETRMKEARKLAMMLKALNEMPTPLIGQIHGAAMGGGVGMACICDMTLAEEPTKFGLTETRLGLIPATISPYVIARMGEGRARQVFMSSKIFKAPEAERLGIISKSVPTGTLDDAVQQEIEPYLHVAPKAVGAAKRLARRLGPTIDEATIKATIEALANTWEGEEAKEGIKAFLTKTKPPWS